MVAVAASFALGLGLTGAALASETVKESVEVPSPPEGKAQVVFFRPGGFGGSAISCAVSEAGVKVSSLPPARYFILVADPGKHTYSAASESKDEVNYNLKPGQTVYVKCSIQTGFFVGRPKLEAADELEFTTKTWKAVSADRMGANVLTEAQIKAGTAPQDQAAVVSAKQEEGALVATGPTVPPAAAPETTAQTGTN